MKKTLLLISIITFVTLFSCKKNYDVDPESTTAVKLIGNWEETSSVLVRYNGSWVKLSEEAQPLGTVSFNSSGLFSAQFSTNGPFEGNYNLSTDAYGEYINITCGNYSFVYKIEEITAYKLVLTLEKHNDTYYVDNVPYVAARSIKTVILSKK